MPILKLTARQKNHLNSDATLKVIENKYIKINQKKSSDSREKRKLEKEKTRPSRALVLDDDLHAVARPTKAMMIELDLLD